MQTATENLAGVTRRLFVSYARQDRGLVDDLRAGLQRLHHDVWVDDRLSGGQAWWAEILAHIRGSDAIIVAVSPALLESKASASERAYARALGKAILPVCVRSMRAELLPPDLAQLQMVDYSVAGPAAAFELSFAISNLPMPPPLPDPLPDLPATPLSYFGDLTERVHADSLTLDQQLILVARLREALSRADAREPALELLTLLKRREDIYMASAREIDALIAAATSGSVHQPDGQPSSPMVRSLSRPDWRQQDPAGSDPGITPPVLDDTGAPDGQLPQWPPSTAASSGSVGSDSVLDPKGAGPVPTQPGAQPGHSGSKPIRPMATAKKWLLIAIAFAAVVAVAVAAVMFTRSPSALATPSLGASVDGNTITVSWSRSPGATEYVLTRDGQTIYDGSEITYVDANLDAEKYSYSVSARDSSGAISAASSPVIAQVVPGPWGNVGFMVAAFPSLLPADPAQQGYNGSACQFSENDSSGPDGTISCFDADGVFYQIMHFPDLQTRDSYIETNGYSALSVTAWNRGGAASGVTYQTPDSEAKLPYIVTSFFEPALENYLIYTDWENHTTTQLVDQWWNLAPF